MKKKILFLIGIFICYCHDGLIDSGEKPPDPLILSIESLPEISPAGVHVALMASARGIIHGAVKSSADPAPTKAEIKSDPFKIEFTVSEDDQGVPVDRLIPRDKLANITKAPRYIAYFFLEKAEVGSSEIVFLEYAATNDDLVLLGIVTVYPSVGSSLEISPAGAKVKLTASFGGIIHGVVKSSAEPKPTKADIKSNALRVEFTISENDRGVPVHYLIPRDKLANIQGAASYTAYFFLERAGVGRGVSGITSLKYTTTNDDLVLLEIVTIYPSVGNLLEISPAGAKITLTASFGGTIHGVIKSSAEPKPTKAEIRADALKVEFTVPEDDQGVSIDHLIPPDKLANITEVAGYTAYFFLETIRFGISEIFSWEYTTTGRDLILLEVVTTDFSLTELIEHGFTTSDLVSLDYSTTKINAILKELASRESSVCSVSTEEAATRCRTVLPETVYDSSDRFVDRLPDQTNKYLIRIDASRVFETADSLTYQIVSGNPKHTIHTTYKDEDILYNLSGYRITSDGKLYPKDVFLLGRNRNKYWGEGFIFSRMRALDYSLFGKYLSQCPVLDNNGLPGCSHFFDDPSRYNHKGCKRVLDCSNFYDYHVEHTFLRTETDTLTIEVKNTSTNVTKTVVVNVYPTPSAFPAPVEMTTPLPASSDGVSCLSAESKVIADCTAGLPLVAYDASPNFITGNFVTNIPKQTNKYLVRVDASGAFPSASRLSYQILSGNPHYKISNEGRIVNLHGYFINQEGEIYTKDVWLLGRNKNAYELDKDQLTRILFHPWLDFRGPFIPSSRCRPVFDSEDVDCSGLHSFRFNYTFGKNKSDKLVIRVTNQDTSEARDITVTINPHPYAVRLASECASDDDLDEWGCINTAPLIPDRTFTTTDAMRNALPKDLVFDKSKYELVAATEFDSFDEMGNMFHVPFWFRESNDITIANGKLQISIRVVPGSESGKCGYSRFESIKSTGVFEPDAGYLEYRVTKYPKIPAKGGNAIMWSRYGAWHEGFWLDLPKRVVRSNGRTSVSRTDLGKLGFAEIDLLERWRYFISPYFVVHTYPGTRSELVNGIPIEGATTEGQYYSEWGVGTSNNDGNGADTYSITYGMEISPGRLSDGRTVNFFKDGTRISGSSFSYGVRDYVNGAAFRITTISDIVIEERPCSSFSPTVIEMDYIRYYRPKDGY